MYDTSLWLGGKEYKSRLIVGTGKYPSFENMREAIEASGAEIVTVAVRRVSLPGQGESLLDYIDTKKYTLLPNTAGCYTADEALRTCYLAREAGLGIRNPYNIKIILETVTVPVIVDAGVGTASDAAIAMELGCDGVLMNTAIAGAKDPVAMATAMKLAIEAGRLAFKAGRIGKKLYATASSPLEGVPDWSSS